MERGLEIPRQVPHWRRGTGFGDCSGPEPRAPSGRTVPDSTMARWERRVPGESLRVGRADVST